jgi:hypothetical protein
MLKVASVKHLPKPRLAAPAATRTISRLKHVCYHKAKKKFVSTQKSGLFQSTHTAGGTAEGRGVLPKELMAHYSGSLHARLTTLVVTSIRRAPSGLLCWETEDRSRYIDSVCSRQVFNVLHIPYGSKRKHD